MSRALKQTIALAALAALPLMASAQLTANVALTTNYKFRGQDQDVNRIKSVSPALQGGFDYAFGDSGFYVGNWNSSVDWLPNNSLETDFYGGYKFSAGDVAFDVGALRYLYSGAGSANTTELYLGASYGIFTAKYSHTVSSRYFGVDGRNTGYLNLGVAYEVVPKVTVSANVGFTRFSSDYKNATGLPNYADYSVGAAYEFSEGFKLAAAVVGANKKNEFGDANKRRFVLTLSKSL
jgi:uncharacterized protein (TIGR02001 family)